MCVCVCVLGVNVCIHVQVPLEARDIRFPTDLELQVVISQLRSVKGTKLKSCTRTVGTLKHRAVSLPFVFFWEPFFLGT